MNRVRRRTPSVLCLSQFNPAGRLRAAVGPMRNRDAELMTHLGNLGRSENSSHALQSCVANSRFHGFRVPRSGMIGWSPACASGKPEKGGVVNSLRPPFPLASVPLFLFYRKSLTEWEINKATGGWKLTQEPSVSGRLTEGCWAKSRNFDPIPPIQGRRSASRRRRSRSPNPDLHLRGEPQCVSPTSPLTKSTRPWPPGWPPSAERSFATCVLERCIRTACSTRSSITWMTCRETSSQLFLRNSASARRTAPGGPRLWHRR